MSDQINQEKVQHDFFKQIEQSLIDAFATLFAPFANLETNFIGHGGFYKNIFAHTNDFAAACCATCALVTREATQVAATRGTPNKVLADELRSQAFENLDSLSVAMARALSECEWEFDQTNAPEAVTKRFQEWFDCVSVVPDLVIDWVGAKCFGGDVNLSVQCDCQQAVNKSVAEYLSKAKEICASLPVLEKKYQDKVEEEIAALRAKVDEESRAEHIDGKTSSPGGCLLTIVLLVLAAGCLFSFL